MYHVSHKHNLILFHKPPVKRVREVSEFVVEQKRMRSAVCWMLP